MHGDEIVEQSSSRMGRGYGRILPLKPAGQSLISENGSTMITGLDQTIGVEHYLVAGFQVGDQGGQGLVLATASERVGRMAEKALFSRFPPKKKRIRVPAGDQNQLMGFRIENAAAEGEEPSATAEFLQHPIDPLSQNDGVGYDPTRPQGDRRLDKGHQQS